MQKVEQYKKENKDQIQKNKSKMGREEYELSELLDIEKQREEYRKQQIIEDETEIKRKKLRVREELIDELMFSNENAKRIVDNFVEAIQGDDDDDTSHSNGNLRPTSQGGQGKFSTGVQFGNRAHGSGAYVPLPSDDGLTYVYKPYQLLINGPIPPSLDDINNKGYLNYICTDTIESTASGFKANFACLRMIQDAFCCLYSGS